MQTKIEGILLSKVPFQDRHLIGKVLLRSGEVISIIFYGGQGGGTKKKSSTLEVGYMLKIELRVGGKKNENLYNAREWKPLWFHRSVRLNHKAFYLMCLILEITNKLAPEGNLYESDLIEQENEGLFRVLSNALFYLEKSLVRGSTEIQYHLVLFLGKLLQEQGIQPQRGHCTLCETNLNKVHSFALSPEHGGFVCSICMNQEEVRGHSLEGFSGLMLATLDDISSMKFEELLESEKEIPVGLNQALFNYFCFQYQLKTNDFKSLGMVF